MTWEGERYRYGEKGEKDGRQGSTVNCGVIWISKEQRSFAYRKSGKACQAEGIGCAKAKYTKSPERSRRVKGQ